MPCDYDAAADTLDMLRHAALSPVCRFCRYALLMLRYGDADDDAAAYARCLRYASAAIYAICHSNGIHAYATSFAYY